VGLAGGGTTNISAGGWAPVVAAATGRPEGASAQKRPRSPDPPPSPSRETHPIEQARTTWAIECMSFDGVDQSIEAPTPSQHVGGVEGLTIAAWVKRSRSNSSNDRLIDFGNGAEKENIVINFGTNHMNYETYQTATDAKSHLSVTDSGSSSSTSPSTSSFPDGAWTHVAVVHASNGMASIFWNGSLRARGKVDLPQPVARSKYYVGRSHWCDDPYFKGNITDVHVFNYPLTQTELKRCAYSRTLPGGNRAKPVLSLANTWREVRNPSPERLVRCTSFGCGCCNVNCIGACNAHVETLQFLPWLTKHQQESTLQQIERACELHHHQLKQMESSLAASLEEGRFHAGQGLQDRIDAMRDAYRRTQSIERMIKYGHRIPQCMKTDAETGQCSQPARLAAAIDVENGLFHALAIYELRSMSSNARSSDTSRSEGDEGPWHVYICDVFSMRQLLPLQPCWREGVGSLLISLLQEKSEADRTVVVLKALCEAPGLETYYEKIGFTTQPTEFEDVGLRDCYTGGEMMRC